MNLLQLMHDAFGRVPEKIRGWLYLAVVLGGLAYIAVTAVQSGLSVDQLVALLVSVVAQLANSNRPAVKAKSRRTQGKQGMSVRFIACDEASQVFRRITDRTNRSTDQED